MAVITGGAGGIGAALAAKLAADGVRLLICDVDGDKAARRADELGEHVFSSQFDVRDPSMAASIAEQAMTRFGRIDYWVNNAGIGVGGEANHFEYADWKNVIDVNLFGVVNGIHAVYPIMVKQGFGHIINIASIAGLAPLPAESSYTASKYAVVGLSQCLRIEAAAYGVNVSVVCPGKVETDIYNTSRIVGFDLHKVMQLWPTGISAEKCAEQILDGVAKNRSTIVVTRIARTLSLLHRLSPGIYERGGRAYMRRLRRSCR